MAASKSQVTLLFFAKARELSGIKESNLEVPSCITCESLLNKIVDDFSLHTIENNLILAVNEEYKERNGQLTLRNGDVIAIIPPLSGG